MKIAVTRDLAQIRAQIEDFLKSAREPALLEPGEELLPLDAENYSLEMRGSRLTLQAWDRTRNWSRRLTAITEASSARLAVTVERFARREGQMFLLDLARRGGAELGKRSGRLVFRERFRLFLRRQLPEWTLAEVSAEADLEHSLSPAFPRAYLKHGQHGWAAIACAPDADSGAVLSFGLIWLAYLRARERRVALEGLAVYLPAGQERSAALRILCLDAQSARFELFTYTDRDDVLRAEPRDYGNLDTRLEPCRRPAPNLADPWQQIADLPGVERIPKHDGRTSLRVRGIEFAELSGNDPIFALGERPPGVAHHRFRNALATPASACAASSLPTSPATPSSSDSANAARRARIMRPKSPASPKSSTARDMPAPIPPTRSTASIPKRGWNRWRAPKSKPWMPPCDATPSTDRCPHSPPASAASSTCWRWIAQAASPSWS